VRILVDIGHPAHVHLFKNMIWGMEKKGHEIKVTTRDKDITIHLLNAYSFDFENMGKNKKCLINKLFGILEFDYKLLKIAKSFNPDIFIGAGSIYATHIAAILRKPFISFDDTEHSTEQYKLYAPFATAICTPSCFKKDLGPKQIRYNGYHEVAYLHPYYFTPDPSVLDELGLKAGERFIIIRFVAWDASHDVGQKGINMEMLRRFVSELGKYGLVLITSESELPAEFAPYRVKVAPEKMHDLLYYAVLYVGEGGTMATEAAVLGTPSVYISSLVGIMGNFEELETKYDLIQAF
jgi:predicted glycosyltransferase